MALPCIPPGAKLFVAACWGENFECSVPIVGRDKASPERVPVAGIEILQPGVSVEALADIAWAE